MIDLSEFLNELPWWKKTWLWLKKWGWVPVGFVILVVGFILGGFIFKKREDGTIIDPLSDLNEAINRNNEQINSELTHARDVRDQEVQRIETEYKTQIEQLNETQRNQYNEMRQNPKKAAKWLTNLARG